MKMMRENRSSYIKWMERLSRCRSHHLHLNKRTCILWGRFCIWKRDCLNKLVMCCKKGVLNIFVIVIHTIRKIGTARQSFFLCADNKDLYRRVFVACNSNVVHQLFYLRIIWPTRIKKSVLDPDPCTDGTTCSLYVTLHFWVRDQNVLTFKKWKIQHKQATTQRMKTPERWLTSRVPHMHSPFARIVLLPLWTQTYTHIHDLFPPILDWAFNVICHHPITLWRHVTLWCHYIMSCDIVTSLYDVIWRRDVTLWCHMT